MLATILFFMCEIMVNSLLDSVEAGKENAKV